MLNLRLLVSGERIFDARVIHFCVMYLNYTRVIIDVLTSSVTW